MARRLEGHAVANALGGTRTHGLSLRRAALYPTELQALDNRGVVPKEGFEPTHPCGYYVLNVARLPFRHFGTPEFGKHNQNNLSDAFAQAGPIQLHTPSVVLRRSDTALAAHIHKWWAVEDLNLGPLACEASALTTELTARADVHVKVPRNVER